MSKGTNTVFYLFAFAVLALLILPVLVMDGMFMDGMLYACVSKNLSHGIGSFWFPHYSSTLYPFFDQQPPLGFGIQSVFFKLLGDGAYVEKLYSFICALINALLIIRLWKVFYRNDDETKNIGWLPVLLWIIVPVCFWSFTNNLLENTMSVFDLLAMIFIVKYLLQNQYFSFLLCAGIFIFLATFTKGVQGSFPLAAFFLGWLVYRPFSFVKMAMASLSVLLVPVIIYLGFMLMSNDAYNSLHAYFNNRVLNSIKNVSEVESRFYLLGRLVQEILPAVIGVVFILGLYYKKLKTKGLVFPYSKHVLFSMLIGISASFPLMITLEQRGFYLTTSLPYFAISLAALAAPGLLMLVNSIKQSRFGSRLVMICSLLVFFTTVGLVVANKGRAFRDKDMLHDVYLIGKTVPPGTVLGSTRALWKNYSLQEYLVRHFYICQADTILPQHRYLLLTDDQKPANIRMEKINIPTVQYHLYKRVEIIKED